MTGFDAATSRFETTIDIDAPADRAWQVMSDVDRWHEWTPSIRSITRLRDAPLAPGTKVVVRQPKFPPALWTVTDVQPGRSFTWVSVAPGMRVTGTHSVEPTASGSRARLSLDYEGVIGRVFARLTKGITVRFIDHEAAGLAARSRDPGFRHGGGA